MNADRETTELAAWGLPLDEIERLGERLGSFYERFRRHLRTTTRDTSAYGLAYLSGLLRLDTERTMANIGRQTGVEPQNMQHFISNSPWAAAGLLDAIRDEMRCHPAFQDEAVLVLDESAEQKTSAATVGAKRQHNGRLGKVEMSQVGVFLALVTPQVSTWIDGELFLPADWFGATFAERRQQVGLPDTRTFQTKPALGWQMIQRVKAQGVPFVAVAMDDLYGRNAQLRQQLAQADIEYYGDVPANTHVYLARPQITSLIGKRGKPLKRPEVSPKAYEVQELLEHPTLEQAWITLRPHQRGLLQARFARRRVWTIHEGQSRQEWLLIRQDGDYITYVLSNAAFDISLVTMAQRKSYRYFIERSNQDAKSELGWDEFQATKYQAWEHQLALTILASWFVAETRLDWATRFERDPNLLSQYEVEVLPLLSVTNVRELLRAALPLPQLSPQQAAALVVEHLVNRTRSRRSRLRRQGRSSGGPEM
jgi:SRSO17 transposase